uniref:Uncharacterized protein n=1 Tax=Cyanothece sp. (strain PCC 7425 / ATCC 29141) TaxID=395961 RepID=B8HZR0_CYAP4
MDPFSFEQPPPDLPDRTEQSRQETPARSKRPPGRTPSMHGIALQRTLAEFGICGADLVSTIRLRLNRRATDAQIFALKNGTRQPRVDTIEEIMIGLRLINPAALNYYLQQLGQLAQTWDYQP